MFSTPLIASSSGAATVCAITVGLAPGKRVLTTTDGGTTEGYSEMGSRPMAIRPDRKMRIDNTAAKMGRSTKNLEKRMAMIRKGWGRAYWRITDARARWQRR